MRKRLLSVLVIIALLFVSASLFVGCQKEEAAAAKDSGEAASGEESSEKKVSKAEVIKEAVYGFFADIPADNNKISQKDFVEKVKAGEDLFIVSIRQAKDYNEGHVKGAVNVPWGPDVMKGLDFLPKDEVVYAYCYSGQTCGQYVAHLNMLGIEAKSVNLGYNFGISKVEGVEDIITTEASEFEGKSGAEFDPVLREAIEDYYAGLADVADTKFKNYKISEDNMKEIVDSGSDDYYILSIRQKDAYDKGHIKGAELIPWGSGMQEQFDKLPTDKKILAYCYSGQTCGQTVAGLRLLGYDAVSLNGGIGVGANKPIGWTNKGYPTVTD